MGKFNIIQFRKETKKARTSLSNIAQNAALARFTALKTDLLKEFENDDITREIEVGPTSSNLSNTLKGKGNLFSFIGFYQEDKPIELVRHILEDLIQMENKPVIEDSGNKVLFKFKVNIPTLETIYVLTPMPWESGRSWLRGIERGISGFGHYMYWKTLPDPPSRSSTGAQVENTLRGGSFTPKPYMSRLLNNFRARLVT